MSASFHNSTGKEDFHTYNTAPASTVYIFVADNTLTTQTQLIKIYYSEKKGINVKYYHCCCCCY